jgi:hypothetical protein
MIIKLPLKNLEVLYINPKQVSAFQEENEKSSVLWLMHDEAQYEIALPADELEKRLSRCQMAVHAQFDYNSLLVNLNFLENLHDISYWIPYLQITLGVIALTLIALTLAVMNK